MIKNNITQLTLTNGDQYTLYANQSDLIFKSNNTDVAVVSKNGVITAVGTGSAIITVINSESDVFQIKLEVIKITVSENTTTSATTNTTSTTTITEIPSLDYILGDVTGDGIIDGRDATDVLTEYAKSSTGQESKYTEEQKKAADINKDGILDGRDATAILTYYAKTSTGYSGTLEEYMESIK